MRTIKTRSNSKNIKILDKTINLSKKMKNAYIRTKERAEDTQTRQHASPTEYASGNIQNKARNAAQASVYHLPNSRQKVSYHWNRAKEHFSVFKRNLPKERQRAAEQAQNAATKARTNAESLRKTADKAHATASEAKAAVTDAKNTLREMRHSGRQTLREVKQGAGRESFIKQNTPSDLHRQNGVERSIRKKIANTAQSASTSKNALDAGKTMQSSAKTTGQAIKSTKYSFKETSKGTIKTAKKSIKTAEQSAKTAVKTAQSAAKAAQKTALSTAKTAKVAERAARAAAKTSAQATKTAARAVVAMVKSAIAATKGLVAALIAGGWVAVLIILIICMIGLLAGSAFGIFFTSEGTVPQNSMSMRAAVSQINTEFAGELARIQRENPHDSCEINADRALWKDILAVYAVKTNTDPSNPLDVMSLDSERVGLLKAIFWDMHNISYWIEELEHNETSSYIDEHGDTQTETYTWYEYILHITVNAKTAAEMAQQLQFSAEQNEVLSELLQPEYDDLWASLLAGAPTGGASVAVSLGIYVWPSNDSDYITSFFGARTHPITGEINFHTGTDIGAAYGSDVLAAADGTVTLAGWNGEYGYCVIIEHDEGNKTLYAHMSMVDVSLGQVVTQGQTIGFVGSTGTSTGPHLHFEIYVNGSRVDPLLYFDNYSAAW